MGADSVVVCYGVRYSLGLDAEMDEFLIDTLENVTDPRLVAAKRARLTSHWGKVTDGGEYFLFIGTVLGPFGVEGKHALSVSDADLGELMTQTRASLRNAGFTEEPAFHFQLEAQY